MSAAEALKNQDAKESLLNKSLNLVDRALAVLGNDRNYSLDELKGAQIGLQALLEANPDLNQDLEEALHIKYEREQINQLVVDIKVGKEAKILKDIEGDKMREMLNKIRFSVIRALAQHADPSIRKIESAAEVTAVTAAGATSPDAANTNATIDLTTTTTSPENTSVVTTKPEGDATITQAEAIVKVAPTPDTPVDTEPADTPKPKLTPEEEADLAEAEAERKKEEEEEAKAKELERVIENYQAIAAFITEDLGIEVKDRSPLAQAIRSALYARVKELDTEKLKEFMDDPNMIAKERIETLNKDRLRIRNELNVTLGKIQVLEAQLKSLAGKGASALPSDAAEQSGRLASDKARLEEEAKAVKDELDTLSKVGPSGEREYNSPESKLIMINYYFAYEDSKKKDKSGKEGKSPKWKNILEDSHKGIEKAEAMEQERRQEWSWGSLYEKVTGLVKPTLESTLEAISKKDETVGKIDKAHLMKLTGIAGEDKGMDQWISGLTGEKKEKMESTLPALIAHLEIALNEGSASNLNTFSQNYTAELLNQMRKAVREYALSQAKLKKDGDTLAKLDTYFESFNGVMDTKGGISKDIILGHVGNRKFWNLATPALATATNFAAYSALLAAGPMAVLLPASGLLAGYLGVKGFQEKDPEKREKLKRWGFRAALSTTLGTAAWGAFGLTSWPVLGIMTVGGVVIPALIKNRKILKQGNSTSTETPPPATASASTP